MTAVIYARYSSDNQREESIEGQIRECTAFAEKNGITVLRHYIDRAFSAKTDNRPEFQAMVKDSGKKLFDMVIVWKLDRFARNRYDSARYKALLKKNGVKVVSATEVISNGAEGIILESVLEGYAEYFSADLSEKVIRGRTENALKCKFNGGTLPIGYVIDSEHHFQIDPLTAPYVLEVFKRYDEGATMTDIRDWLNGQGIKNAKGQQMTYNSIDHILKNRRYRGEYKYRDIVVPDGIPAIVPQDLFDRVQEKLEKNRRAPARHKAEEDYLLTTKLYCGYCGAYMFGESGASHTGKVYRYYKCFSAKRKCGSCHKKPVKKQFIENLVVNRAIAALQDDKTIEAIVAMVMDLQERENTGLPLYEQQLKEAETGINNLLNAIQQGILTPSTKSRLEELEATKEDLEVRIANEKLAKPKLTAEFVTMWLERFRNLDMRKKEHRQQLIDTFVNSVYVYDDKLEYTINYKDGTETITFEEASRALAEQESGSDMESSAPLTYKLKSALIGIRQRRRSTWSGVFAVFPGKEIDMKRPVIGIVPLVDIQRESYWMLPGYMDGVTEAGGLPLMLPLTDDEKQIDQLMALCDGFLFTGGQDVSPSLYGEEKDEACGECCWSRDAMEVKLLNAALRHDKPIFGICRGIQFINAALGGTLYQDLPSQHPSKVEHHQRPPYDVPVHAVTPIPSTPLAALLGEGAFPVNNYHHQAVKELAPAWSAMAVAPDGIIEAAYMPDKRFVWAVQWHPEFSFRVDGNSRKLFLAFVQAAEEGMNAE